MRTIGLAEVANPAICHMLFIDESVSPRLRQQAESDLRGVLTVSDLPNFARAGGNIGCFIANNQLRFQINLDAARRSGIAFSSKLLRLAEVIGQRPSLPSNFQGLVFTGSNVTLNVTNTSGTLGVTISGFDATSEIIDLTAIGANGTITYSDTATGRITITGTNGAVTLQFDTIVGASSTTQPDGAGGTDLVACFCRGTRVRSDAVEVRIGATELHYPADTPAAGTAAGAGRTATADRMPSQRRRHQQPKRHGP